MKLIRYGGTIFFDLFLMFWFQVFGKAGTRAFLGSGTEWLQLSILAKSQSSISWRKRLPGSDRFLTQGQICLNLVIQPQTNNKSKHFENLFHFQENLLIKGYQNRKFKNVHLDILQWKISANINFGEMFACQKCYHRNFPFFNVCQHLAPITAIFKSKPSKNPSNPSHPLEKRG